MMTWVCIISNKVLLWSRSLLLLQCTTMYITTTVSGGSSDVWSLSMCNCCTAADMNLISLSYWTLALQPLIKTGAFTLGSRRRWQRRRARRAPPRRTRPPISCRRWLERRRRARPSECPAGLPTGTGWTERQGRFRSEVPRLFYIKDPKPTDH